MENDLSKCKIGDWIATTVGSKQLNTSDYTDVTYPIAIGDKTYTSDGKYKVEDIVPSAFVNPPEWLLEYIGPKPCEFEKDELVMVRMRIDHRWCLRYFAQHKKKGYATYDYGKTSYTAKGAISVWKYCRKAVEGEDY